MGLNVSATCALRRHELSSAITMTHPVHARHGSRRNHKGVMCTTYTNLADLLHILEKLHRKRWAVYLGRPMPNAPP